MKSAIILHGKPSKRQFEDPNFPSTSNYFWLPWLQKQLALKGIPANTPEVPNNWRADYPVWLKELERYEVTPETILVGHSCGAGFLLRWLSEHKNVRAGRVVLAAPWLNPKNEEDTGDFFKFNLDPELVNRTDGLRVLYSTDDYQNIIETVGVLRQSVKGIFYRVFQDYGHFFDERRTTFPELLEEVMA